MKDKKTHQMVRYTLSAAVLTLPYVGCDSSRAPEEAAAVLPPKTPVAHGSRGRQHLIGHLRPELASVPVVSRVPGSTPITLTVGLPVRDREALKIAVRRVSDPRDPSFRRYLTQERFADRFGATQAQYQAVVEWANGRHFSVSTHGNRLTLEATATVSDVEAALNVHLNYAFRPDGTQYYAPDSEPSLDLDVPVEHIANLDNYTAPKASANDGSGNYGDYTMLDLRNAYLTGITNVGQYGPTIAVVNTNNQCFLQTDINSYTQAYANATGESPPAIQVDSYLQSYQQKCGVGPGLTLPGLEVTLDVSMVRAMAPMATVEVFGGATFDQALERRPC